MSPSTARVNRSLANGAHFFRLVFDPRYIISHYREKATNRDLAQLQPEDAYLSYFDIRVYKEDVESIKNNDWVTDNAISFWEEYLEREHIRKSYPKLENTIILVRPPVAELLKARANPKGEQGDFGIHDTATHIFVPINDREDVNEAGGGTHWSLLLISVVDGVAFHYDSNGSSNENDARKCTQKMATMLSKSFRYIEMKDSPQQNNGSDCGVFVCLLMRYLLMNRLLKTDSTAKISMSMAGKDVDAAHGRKEIFKIIESFRKEGRRRRS